MQSNEVLLQNYKILIQKINEYNGQYETKSKLLLVSKNLEQDQIEHIIVNTKQRIFGENKVQDAIDKWSDTKENHPNIRLHLIGKLQTNKIKKAVWTWNTGDTGDDDKRYEIWLDVGDSANHVTKKDITTKATAQGCKSISDGTSEPSDGTTSIFISRDGC